MPGAHTTAEVDMPHMQINGANLYYETQGSGSETIVFAHGLLFSGAMFGEQIAALKDRYPCVTFDFRGQGQSQVTQAGYDVETLYADAVALIESLGCAPCHFAGLSMGGFVGLRIGIRRPELLRSLILIETSSEPEPQKNMPRYAVLTFVARWLGLRMAVDPVMQIMFGRAFLDDPQRADQRLLWKQRILANDRIGITRAVSGIIPRPGVTDQLMLITTPTLIIVGDQDVATAPAEAERMHAGISGSQLAVVPRAGHSSTIEEPAAVTAAMRNFLARQAA
jgi:pimeloyl-ACP methyl ester carboxylesterase